MSDAAKHLMFKDVAAWRAWLETHHATEKEALVLLAKGKTIGLKKPQALEEALIFGWIDGVGRPVDDAWWMQRFTPRTPRSRWSRVNVDKVGQLIAAGRMHEAGLAQVAAAKADGRWVAAYEPPSTIQPIPELAAALKANPKAAEAFSKLDSANRYAILHRTHALKTPEARARKVAGFIAMLERGETVHPPRAKKKAP